jgi:two-component system, OmpR family, manganese sensing sensor histidine kinase
LPSDFERRLLLSYLSVFAGVLAVFALATHFAFATIFDREAGNRLKEMAQTAESVVDATNRGLAVDVNDETIRALNPRTEGLRWTDTSGHVVAVFGLQSGGAQRQSIRTLSNRATIHDGQSRDVVIEAAVAETPYAQALRRVDLGILGALALAVFCSLIAGRWLTRKLVRGLETNLKALQDFTADAAHELRGPLTAIVTSTAGAVPLNDTQVAVERESMDSIASATTQMVRVTEDLLTLARSNQPLERELFIADLDEIVMKIVSLYRLEARQKGLTLDPKLLDHARVYGNPDQIQRIVGNLVQNAIHYTPPGGSVEITCRKDRRGSRVVVKDTGIGIAADHFERVFDRFWRADSSRSPSGGSGLGLTIARELARRHGGDITFSSRPGAGSAFTVTFPSRPPRSPRWL